MIEEQLGDVKRALEVVNVDSDIHGRMRVLSFGENPSSPDSDPRAMWATAAGLGGLLLGVGATRIVSRRRPAV